MASFLNDALSKAMWSDLLAAEFEKKSAMERMFPSSALEYDLVVETKPMTKQEWLVSIINDFTYWDEIDAEGAAEAIMEFYDGLNTE